MSPEQIEGSEDIEYQVIGPYTKNQEKQGAIKSDLFLDILVDTDGPHRISGLNRAQNVPHL